jgi:hypothetical protein
MATCRERRRSASRKKQFPQEKAMPEVQQTNSHLCRKRFFKRLDYSCSSIKRKYKNEHYPFG